MSKSLKSILFLIVLLLWLFNFQNTQAWSSTSGKNTYFIVTAYYSPLPNQKRYTTWSYLWDKRLNWEWHTTASGKPVFTWILAAPRKYPFGTKIYFEWFWVWVVEDRWWAIVKAGVRWYEHDRIDIWVWYWDEWLTRALQWWKRTIKGRVVSPNQEVNLKFSENILSGLSNIIVNPKNYKKEDVKKLQQNFQNLGLYSWEIDWKYSSIKKDLINFQVSNRVIRSRNDKSAWWFWPRTYTTLLRKFGTKDVLVKQSGFKIFETSPKVQIILSFWEIKLNWENSKVSEVKKVQELFKKLWLYSGKIDWNFQSIRRNLLDFQKKVWIIRNDNSWWAGFFWARTKAELITYFQNQNKIKDTNKQSSRVTLDDISYETIKEIWKKIRELKTKDKFLSRLETNIKKIKNPDHKSKIKFLIKTIKS